MFKSKFLQNLILTANLAEKVNKNELILTKSLISHNFPIKYFMMNRFIGKFNFMWKLTKTDWCSKKKWVVYKDPIFKWQLFEENVLMTWIKESLERIREWNMEYEQIRLTTIW